MAKEKPRESGKQDKSSKKDNGLDTDQSRVGRGWQKEARKEWDSWVNRYDIDS
jgi:hypothetical protein